MNTPLLPCPFCGSPAYHYPDGDMEGYSIMCSGKGALFHANREHCPLASFGYASAEDAERAWNTRATDELSGQALKTTEKPNEPS